MAKFFIHRPVFAWVLAIVTMLVGGFAVWSLPISKYPDIAPTTVRISASYSGASAETVENSVTTTIEDGLTGLDGLLYMTSTSRQGRASVSLVFGDDVDPDVAQVQVQNKLQLVNSQLPDVVQENGVDVSRSSSSILLVGALVSEDGARDTIELGDMVDQFIIDPVKRLEGVGSVDIFGSGYAMRIWLDPLKMVQYQVTTADVTSAVANQNTNVTVGNLGAQPTVQGQQFTVAVSAQSQLRSVDEFERILLRVREDGSTVFLGDVAKVEIGQESYGSAARFDGKTAAGFAVNLATGANAVSTAEAVRAQLDQIATTLPAGVTVTVPYDTSPFVKESITKVYHTLIEAVVLVFLVILVFLQSWRATLIPTIAVPVVLLGTFGVLSAFGMSINTLTMFAMVLAIGLLVDDAIVVVENVERVMEEEGLGPVEATEKSMTEISGALIGIVLVLSAVFLPMAFMSGSTGVIYRQFSVTIISAMVLSLGVALILTPAMCASLLRPRKHGDGIAPARWFNRQLDRLTRGYGSSVGWISRRALRALIVLVAIGGGVVALYDTLPSSFLPQEDQGVMMVIIELPEGATADRTLAVVEKLETYLLTEEKETVKSVFAALGFGFSGTGSNRAMMFVSLRDYDERGANDVASLVQRANGRYFGSRLGRVIFLQPPAIQGLGSSSGFTMQLIDQSGAGSAALSQAATDLIATAQADGKVEGLRGESSPTETTLRLDLDQQKATAFGLSVSEVNAMLSVIFTGRSVNDFVFGGELRPVIVQGAAEARMQPEDIEQWHARNSAGEMVPFSAITTQVWEQQSKSLARYGGTRATEISGSAVKGVSSGDAMTRMEELVAEMPGGYAVAWTGLSYQERLSGNQAPLLYALSVVVVFLCLAALYESWSVPLAVMMTVPIGVAGALAAALMFDQQNDVYFKVGLLTTIGLAARNAILIVEFAHSLYEKGTPLVEAATLAARQRLRPILMTTLAFMLGVLPLAIATGAGAGAQRAIGTGVLGGMTASAVIGIFFVPAFYVAVMKLVAMTGRKPVVRG
ncbi:multidrug efflux pump [Gemmobacter aquatilis]|uniref:Efflux pump membrane transporter n=1 Tax=Gemmobacter aquatilis TaxID=933059 RepID=A0A1H7YG89_9RHOB|nr:efflux RND transporter permease subunit [Gemmobacter aquatilis]SEM44911.1 multidrug efflux pump [Gemmobacter aquatilis]